MRKTSIPAIPFMRGARDWAIQNRVPFFTWDQQQEAILSYLNHLKSLKSQRGVV